MIKMSKTCQQCKLSFVRIDLHTETKCLANQNKSRNANSDVAQISIESNASQTSNVGPPHMNQELIEILLKKIDAIANSNSEIVSTIEKLNSKINDIEQKLIECINSSVVKDSISQFSLRCDSSNSTKPTTSIKNQYIDERSPVKKVSKNKVNKKLYIIGLNDNGGNDQYHMNKIFNWLSCDSPIFSKRINNKKFNYKIVQATFYNRKTIKLALENANRMENLFGYENVFLFEHFSEAINKLSTNKPATKVKSYKCTESKQLVKQSSYHDSNICSNVTNIKSVRSNTPNSSEVLHSSSSNEATNLTPCKSILVNNKKDVQIQNNKKSIKPGDLNTLEPGKRLNDTIVNSYLTLIERSDTICLSSFLTTKFLKSDYKVSEKWFKKGIYKNYDLKSIKHVIVPIFIRNDKHWILLTVDINNMSYSYYNSLSSCNLDKQSIDLILNGISHNFKHLNIKRFRRSDKQDIPKQDNGFDCGMFICLYARYYLSDDEFTFNQSMINNFRLHFKVELESMKLNCISNIDPSASTL
jgi:hypothetical protein